jgi:hypothetical protein
MNENKNRIASIGMAILIIVLLLMFSARDVQLANAQSSITVAEGNDFATRVLRDAWDMNEFSDVSQYLNNSGQLTYLQNIQVANGVFSATSVTASPTKAQFWPLFPDYLTAIKTGKVGARYPIQAATYKCLYVAMNVQTASGDTYQVQWFADDRLNGGTYGGTYDFAVSPSIWQLDSVNLATNSLYWGTHWNNVSQWQGLMISPTARQNIPFSVDWVRLTDCNTVNATITWSPNAGVNAIWVTPSGTSRNILVATGVNGSAGSYVLDTQGLAQGTYQVSLGTATTCCTVNANVLTVNQTPIANFTSPSFTSGTDYATQVGNPWDFSDSSDVTSYSNISTPSYSSGLMTFSTASGSLPNGADPMLYLNTPQTIPSGSAYRYLTFIMNTQYSIQNVPNGMIVRLIWRVGTNCWLVSQDIPFDVGWQTYSIDLSDAFNGSVIQMSPSGCASSSITWSTSTNVTQIRFDPNENALGQSLTQQLDQIWLTQMNRVASGTPFPAQIKLNKSPSLVPTCTFYYTTNPSNPYQNLAQSSTLRVPKPKVGQSSSIAYLPFVMTSQAVPTPSPTPLPPTPPPPDPNAVDFSWDTTGVASGMYYLCVQLSDGINQATYCSPVPIQVY